MFRNVDAAPPLPYDALTPQHLLYHLIYNPEQTLFLKGGAGQGATVFDGYQSLVRQAGAGWAIGNGAEDWG